MAAAVTFDENTCPTDRTRTSAAYCGQGVQLGLIGLGNTAIDLGVFTFAYNVLGLPLVPSNIMAWLITVSSSYVMNTLITFRVESGRVLERKDYLSFVASAKSSLTKRNTGSFFNKVRHSGASTC